MSQEAEPSESPVGTRWVLPCGHPWTVPWGDPPEVVAADLVRHQSVCDLDAGAPLFAMLRPSPGGRLVPMEAEP